MGLDLVGALLEQLEADPDRAAAVADLLRPHMAAECVAEGTLLTVSEVAAATGLSEKTIRRRIDDGVLDSLRIGRAVRVKPEALSAFLEISA